VSVVASWVINKVALTFIGYRNEKCGKMKWPQNENAKNWDFSSKMKVVLNRLTENAGRDYRGTKVTKWLKYRMITKQ